MTQPVFRLRQIFVGSIFLLIVIVGIGARTFTLTALQDSNDMSNFEHTAHLMRDGQNIYTATPFYNYSPVYAWILAGLLSVPIPFGLGIRLILTCADFGISVLLAKLTKRPEMFLFYWLNPFSILATRLEGQFESLALLCILGALWFWQRSRPA